ncbi:MAG: hypothetical protein HYR49_09480 [Gammaproteobacteria bacterium]|nr:hypothetical protein [Gammaproteobacteria bacterium]
MAVAPASARTHRPPRGLRGGRRQRGVILLALLLVVLVGSSYALLGKLNQLAEEQTRDVQTQKALKQAKEALIQYAVNYPEIYSGDLIRGPGYLPCPDQDAGPDDADNLQDDGQVGQSNCAEATGTTIGRLPTRDLGLDDLVDSSGERLWYAVAQEYKNNQSSAHVMNSETFASLRVDGSDEEIVAIVIAPGAPIDGQDGRGTAVEEITQTNPPTNAWYQVVDEYLEDGNATNGDGEYVTASTVADSPPQCTDGSLDDDELEIQCFNDRILTITRAELMAAVEARVANEVRATLESWRDDVGGGAYPWLEPYVDPRRGGRHGASLGGYGLSGRHTSSTASSLTLTDANADFLSAGVAAGDRVWNVSDGSFGTVSSVTAATVTVGGLEGGAANMFSKNDIYYIEAVALDLGAFDGVAGAGSGGTTLDADSDLESFGVVAGDIVDNITTGTSGTVISVDGNEVELDGDSGVVFTAGDSYRVRSAIGVASAGSGTTTLVDAGADFPALGVVAGDVVRNLTDGSQGIVATIGTPDDQTLTVSSLYGGSDNVFAANDSYALIRQLPASNTRYGLLPVHEMGKPFVTDFTVKWSLTSANGNTVSVSAAGAATAYTTAITNWIQQSTLYSDSTGADATYPDAVTADSDIACIWSGNNIAHCSGKFVDSGFLTATAESVTQSGTMYQITDTGTRFSYSGVRPGAKIRNLDQPAVDEGIVHLASSLTQNLVRAVEVVGGTPFAVAAGNRVQMLVASKRTPLTGSYTADGSTVPNLACSTGANFWSFIGAGDTIRYNTAGFGNPVGLITGAPSADCVSYTDLQGGTTTSIAVGQLFSIQYDFVEERQWEFRMRMAGDSAINNASAGVVERSVCQGFGADCATQYADALDVADNVNPVIQFTDFDSGGNQLGTASVTIPAAGAAQGSLVASGISLLLDVDEDDNEVEDTEDGNLPRWFLRNRWHEYVFVSYSNALTPDSVSANINSDCIAGTDCINVEVPVPAGTTHNDRKAVVVVAGGELDTQNRGAGTFESYFEGENADEEAGSPEELFERADADTTFNDQLSAVIP